MTAISVFMLMLMFMFWLLLVRVVVVLVSLCEEHVGQFLREKEGNAPVEGNSE